VHRDLPPDELQRFLDEPLIAILATYRRDGSAILSPVWHEWDGSGFNLVVGADDVKAKCLRRDPRASLVVAQQVPPYTGAEMRTDARFTDDDAIALNTRLATRYLGEAAARGYIEGQSARDFVAIRLEGGTMRSWDYRDYFPPGGIRN
jgi:PPOX class probable F420-dependent enzyme